MAIILAVTALGGELNETFADVEAELDTANTRHPAGRGLIAVGWTD